MKDKLPKEATLRIQILGPFEVWRHQELLTLPTQKTKALFQILLVEPGQLVSKDQILEYLWPDLPFRKAQNNLWVTVSQLRRVLQPNLQPRAPSAYIVKQGEGYCFNVESSYWMDGDAFAAHLAAAQSATDLTIRITAWEAARALYKGDYLGDELYAEWAQFPRIQWKRRFEQLMVNLALAYRQNGRYQQTINLSQEILNTDNINETAARLLMSSHAALGERTAALKVYAELADSLQDEIGVDPMPETVELARQIKLPDGKWKPDEQVFPLVSTPLQIPSPFVGRGVEIDRLTRLLKQVTVGQGQTVLIAGELGIGKSRLVSEAAVVAHQDGFRILSTHCYHVEQSMPYQPLIDLARQVMANDVLWKQLAPVWLRELAILVPEMEATAAAARTVSSLSDELDDSQQGRLYQAIFQLFAKHAERSKLLIIIDDIHWADSATLQCLHYLTRHIDRVPIILIFALRGENISSDADLITMLHGLKRESNVTSLLLTRLTKADTTALLEQTADTAPHVDQLSQWLYQETDGNPFFFTSLLQSMREDGLLDNAAEKNWSALAQADPSLTLPDVVRDLVRDRLQDLPLSEQESLNWIAVYGRPLDFSTLQAISLQPHLSLLNAVEKLVERQLLVETTGQYDFDHHKIRDVVYYDLSAARREFYHRQIAEMLQEMSPSPSNASILAHHFEHGRENEVALAYWMQAGKHAQDTYAYQQSVHHYERALALADQPAAQMDAYLGLGIAFMFLDDHEAAATVLQQALLLAERFNDLTRRAGLLYTMALNVNRQHRPDGGVQEVEAALAAAEEADNQVYLAKSLLLITEVHESSGDLSSALETASRAQKVSVQLNDVQLQARATVEIGFLYTQQAEFDEAAIAAEHGIKLLAGSNDRSAVAYAWNILGRALAGRGDYSRALKAFDRCQEEAQITGDRYLLAQVFNMRGWIYRELGDYQRALNFDQQGVDFAKQWDKPSPEISARLNMSIDMLYLDKPRQALDLLDKIEQQINVGSFGFHNWRWQMRLLHARALCSLALDDPEKALALSDEGLLLAEKTAARKYTALNHALKGQALAKLAHLDGAISELQLAISLADAIQYQPLRWTGRLNLADLHRQSNHQHDADKILAEAENIIQTIAAALEDEELRTTFLNTALP
ncbi:MAG: AAA family ATPase [Chloroflexota bacterium]